MKITWLQKMDNDHLDSVWYGGDIVNIRVNRRYDVVITAAGDIRAEIKGGYYCDKNNGGMFVEYLNENGIHSDKELKEAIQNGDIEFKDNNWFELIIWDKKKRDYVDYYDNVVDLEPNDNFKWVKDYVKCAM